jgi:hypothetical protein
MALRKKERKKEFAQGCILLIFLVSLP